MAEHLTHISSIPPQLSTQWIEADLLLPLLDGLDEVDPSARLACISTSNAFHLERFAVPLVLCSRKSDYELAALKRRLVLQRAVVVQPLTTEQRDTTLAVGGKPLAALRSALKKNRTLRELATTPLMLSVLMMTYQGATVRALSTQGSHLQQQVWEDSVQRMIRSRGDTMLYPLDVTKRWLGWLAREMRRHNLTTFSLEQFQPDWLPGRHRWFYWVLYRSIGGLLLGLCGLPLGLTPILSHFHSLLCL
jgi:predicted NACHT family NTPase